MSLPEPLLQRLDTAEDLLAAIARIDDFHHYRSLICVLAREQRAIGAFRIDLPSREAEAACALHLLGLIAATEADALALVLYSGRTSVEPRARFIGRLARLLVDAGYELYGPLWVGLDEWGFYGGPAGCSRLPAAAYAAARPPGTVSLGRSASARAQRQRCTLVLELLERAGWSGPSADEPSEWAERLLLATAPSDATVTQLTSLLRRPGWRDRLWLALAFEPPGVLEPAPTIDSLFGLDDCWPNAARLTLLCDRLERLRARVPLAAEVELLCLWAWSLWALGRGTAALLALRRAERLEPGHALAKRLGALVLAGAVPPWLLTPDGPAAARQARLGMDGY